MAEATVKQHGGALLAFPRHGGLRAHFVRATPLFDDHGKQIRLAKPGEEAAIIGTYTWQPGPGSEPRERAIVRCAGGDYDVDRASVWAE
jgi:hypothetical protein